jgi:hypothetical protein
MLSKIGLLEQILTTKQHLSQSQSPAQPRPETRKLLWLVDAVCTSDWRDSTSKAILSERRSRYRDLESRATPQYNINVVHSAVDSFIPFGIHHDQAPWMKRTALQPHIRGVPCLSLSFYWCFRVAIRVCFLQLPLFLLASCLSQQFHLMISVAHCLPSYQFCDISV